MIGLRERGVQAGFSGRGRLRASNVVASLLGLTAVASAGDRPAQGREATPEELYRRLAPSVVTVISSGRDGKPLKTGSGVVLSAAGRIVTNYHVVEGGTFFDIKFGGSDSKPIPARPSECAPHEDLAVLTVAPVQALKPVRISISVPSVGARVFALGSPLDLEATLSEGIVSQVRADGNRTLIQTTAAMSPGSSGGGLFLASGELVGITSYSRSEGQALNFALSSAAFAKLMPCDGFATRTGAAPVHLETPGQNTPRESACQLLDELGTAMTELMRERKLADNEFRGSGRSPSLNEHYSACFAKLGALVDSASRGHFDAIPESIRVPIEVALAEFTSRYTEMMVALSKPQSPGSERASIEAMAREDAAYLEFVKAILRTGKEATTLCPSYGKIIHGPLEG